MEGHEDFSSVLDVFLSQGIKSINCHPRKLKSLEYIGIPVKGHPFGDKQEDSEGQCDQLVSSHTNITDLGSPGYSYVRVQECIAAQTLSDTPSAKVNVENDNTESTDIPGIKDVSDDKIPENKSVLDKTAETDAHLNCEISQVESLSEQDFDDIESCSNVFDLTDSCSTVSGHKENKEYETYKQDGTDIEEKEPISTVNEQTVSVDDMHHNTANLDVTINYSGVRDCVQDERENAKENIQTACIPDDCDNGSKTVDTQQNSKKEPVSNQNNNENEGFEKKLDQYDRSTSNDYEIYIDVDGRIDDGDNNEPMLSSIVTTNNTRDSLKNVTKKETTKELKDKQRTIVELENPEKQECRSPDIECSEERVEASTVDRLSETKHSATCQRKEKDLNRNSKVSINKSNLKSASAHIKYEKIKDSTKQKSKDNGLTKYTNLASTIKRMQNQNWQKQGNNSKSIQKKQDNSIKKDKNACSNTKHSDDKVANLSKLDKRQGTTSESKQSKKTEPHVQNLCVKAEKSIHKWSVDRKRENLNSLTKSVRGVEEKYTYRRPFSQNNKTEKEVKNKLEKSMYGISKTVNWHDNNKRLQFTKSHEDTSKRKRKYPYDKNGKEPLNKRPDSEPKTTSGKSEATNDKKKCRDVPLVTKTCEKEFNNLTKVSHVTNISKTIDTSMDCIDLRQNTGNQTDELMKVEVFNPQSDTNGLNVDNSDIVHNYNKKRKPSVKDLLQMEQRESKKRVLNWLEHHVNEPNAGKETVEKSFKQATQIEFKIPKLTKETECLDYGVYKDNTNDFESNEGMCEQMKKNHQQKTNSGLNKSNDMDIKEPVWSKETHLCNENKTINTSAETNTNIVSDKIDDNHAINSLSKENIPSLSISSNNKIVAKQKSTDLKDGLSETRTSKSERSDLPISKSVKPVSRKLQIKASDIKWDIMSIIGKETETRNSKSERYNVDNSKFLEVLQSKAISKTETSNNKTSETPTLKSEESYPTKFVQEHSVIQPINPENPKAKEKNLTRNIREQCSICHLTFFLNGSLQRHLKLAHTHKKDNENQLCGITDKQFEENGVKKVIEFCDVKKDFANIEETIKQYENVAVNKQDESSKAKEKRENEANAFGENGTRNTKCETNYSGKQHQNDESNGYWEKRNVNKQKSYSDIKTVSENSATDQKAEKGDCIKQCENFKNNQKHVKDNGNKQYGNSNINIENKDSTTNKLADKDDSRNQCENDKANQKHGTGGVNKKNEHSNKDKTDVNTDSNKQDGKDNSRKQTEKHNSSNQGEKDNLDKHAENVESSKQTGNKQDDKSDSNKHCENDDKLKQDKNMDINTPEANNDVNAETEKSDAEKQNEADKNTKCKSVASGEKGENRNKHDSGECEKSKGSVKNDNGYDGSKHGKSIEVIPTKSNRVRTRSLGVYKKHIPWKNRDVHAHFNERYHHIPPRRKMEDLRFKCLRCHERFPSIFLLKQHLKDQGHWKTFR